jgi:hypothetical protein
MNKVYNKNIEIFENFKEKLNSLLENDKDIEINSTDELVEKYTDYIKEDYE